MYDKKTYDDVGFDAGLRGRNLNRYVEYMRTRWGDTEEQKCRDGYAFEWAERFSDGYEYEASDITGVEVLLEMDKNWIQSIEDRYRVKLDEALNEMSS